MATRRPRTAPAARPTITSTTPGPLPDKLKRRVQTEYIDINDLQAYEYNPRDNSKAISAVAASIRSFGFLIPCVIDDNNILVAGHTRVEAAKTLGMIEVPCIRASHLTPDEANAFRLIDNKVAEQAVWDFDLLAGEIGKIGDLGLNLTEYGWTQQEVDCLSELVSADCLSTTNLTPAAAPEETDETGSRVARRAPQTARMVLGELTFFLPIQEYRHWIDGLRQLHDFNEEAMAEDVRTRLGIHRVAS